MTSDSAAGHYRVTGPTINRVRDLFPQGGAMDDALAAGKARRESCPRSAHGELRLPADRDPLATIARTEADRQPDLLGIRAERMGESEFAYFRGTADVMAADLAAGPSTGIETVICADAHVSNFGLYATPERRLIFDLNDFDEAWVGPWEWDVKRMAVSLDLVLREKGADAATRTAAVASAAGTYCAALRARVEQPALDRYYSSIDADWLVDAANKDPNKIVQRSVRRARRRTSEQLLDKITLEGPTGDRRIVSDPPVLVPVTPEVFTEIRERFAEYLATLRPDRALLISQFRLVDAARRVVGVGSVGTRCAIVLLEGPGGASLFLQIKEACHSVAAKDGMTVPGGEGFRVVTCQEVLQSASDPFLGWTMSSDGRSYYWRQFRDMKGDLDTDRMTIPEVVTYGRLCATTLARAHSQSPNSVAVAGYLGSGGRFPEAVARWAGGYADQIGEDYRAYLAGHAGVSDSAKHG